MDSFIDRARDDDTGSPTAGRGGHGGHVPCPPVWTSRVRSEGLWKTTPAQWAPIGTVPDKQAQIAASGVGPKARFLTIFFFFKKIGTRRTEIWIWKMAGDKDVRWSEQ